MPNFESSSQSKKLKFDKDKNWGRRGTLDQGDTIPYEEIVEEIKYDGTDATKIERLLPSDDELNQALNSAYFGEFRKLVTNALGAFKKMPLIVDNRIDRLKNLYFIRNMLEAGWHHGQSIMFKLRAYYSYDPNDYKSILKQTMCIFNCYIKINKVIRDFFTEKEQYEASIKMRLVDMLREDDLAKNQKNNGYEANQRFRLSECFQSDDEETDGLLQIDSASNNMQEGNTDIEHIVSRRVFQRSLRPQVEMFSNNNFKKKTKTGIDT